MGCDADHTKLQVKGVTWQEVLKNLLDDVTEFEMSKSSDEIVNMVSEMQANHKGIVRV